MFKKKECPKCGKKTRANSNFCSECGSQLRELNDDFGMLGKNDLITPQNDFEKLSESFFGNLGGNMLGKMLGTAMKMLEKEIQREMNPKNFRQNFPESRFELFINGKRISPDKIKVSQKRVQKPVVRKNIAEVGLRHFSHLQQKKFSKLKQVEPKTNVKRFSDKIIYEVDVPGVESIKDISIVRLENSIEIKAISKNKAYFKVLSVNFPIIAYELNNKKLVLELGIKD